MVLFGFVLNGRSSQRAGRTEALRCQNYREMVNNSSVLKKHVNGALVESTFV